DILQRALAQGRKRKGELVLDLLANRAGEADAGASGKLLQARSDVDAIAQEIVSLRDDVADVDGDAKLHPLALWQVSNASLQPALDCDRGAHPLHGARGLRHH